MKTDTKIGFIITYFYNSPQSLELLKKNMQILGQQNYYLILASHSPVESDIQELCDFYFYQSKNVVDNRKYSHGVAESNLIELSLKHLKEQDIFWTYKVSYDIEINDVIEFEKWKVPNFDFVSCLWGDNIICTNSFFANVNFLLENITFPKTIDEMFRVNSVLENCWENDIKQKKITYRIFSFSSKGEFYGKNKIDILFYDYNKVDFWYSQEELKFFIKSNLTGKFHLRIFDYYTDLCVYLNRDFELANDIVYWIVPPFSGNLPKSKNGFYLEVYLENETIVKNFGITDFDYKHKLSKKFKLIKSKEVKFNEYSDFDNLSIYPDLSNIIDNIINFVDIGANYGMASISFIERGIKTYLVEPDINNCDILRTIWSKNSKIQIIDRAITKEDGEVDFWISPGIDSVVSSIYESGANGQNQDRIKSKVLSITPNRLFEEYINEEQIDLVKLDVEGAEYDFFDTISDNNLKKIKRMIIEYHNNYEFKVMNILKKLTKNNFKFKLQKWSPKCGDYIIENEMGVIYAEQLI